MYLRLLHIAIDSIQKVHLIGNRLNILFYDAR